MASIGAELCHVTSWTVCHLLELLTRRRVDKSAAMSEHYNNGGSEMIATRKDVYRKRLMDGWTVGDSRPPPWTLHIASAFSDTDGESFSRHFFRPDNFLAAKFSTKNFLAENFFGQIRIFGRNSFSDENIFGQFFSVENVFDH